MVAGGNAEQVADALEGRVGVAAGVLRQQLVGHGSPVGRRATTSVNVPPRSIQNCQPEGLVMGGSHPLVRLPQPNPVAFRIQTVAEAPVHVLEGLLAGGNAS